MVPYATMRAKGCGQFSSHFGLLRRARGWSLGDLAERVGFVSRQMLHKYETGASLPSPGVARRLASVLNVPIKTLFSEPPAEIVCSSVGYRHFFGLRRKEKLRIEESVRLALQPRIVLSSIFVPGSGRLPRKVSVRGTRDIEAAAAYLRRVWNLGGDPIAHLIACLEDRGVQVLLLNADSRFDGTGLVVSDTSGTDLCWAVVVKKDVCAEHQRLSIAHELGHLLMRVPPSAQGTKQEEKYAFDFAGAFLAPADAVYRRVGHKRRQIRLEELLLLKKYFGMSVQAVLCRLLTLQIISDRYFTLWFRELGRRGWRTREPEETGPEESVWLRHAVLRLRSERIKTAAEIRTLFAASFERDHVESVLAGKTA